MKYCIENSTKRLNNIKGSLHKLHKDYYVIKHIFDKFLIIHMYNVSNISMNVEKKKMEVICRMIREGQSGRGSSWGEMICHRPAFSTWRHKFYRRKKKENKHAISTFAKRCLKYLSDKINIYFIRNAPVL